MPDPSPTPLTRRAWLGRMAAPALLAAAAGTAGETPPAGRRAGSVHDIRDYGAQGDGVALDTAALQAAIDACAPDGGTVLVPPGTFRIGTVELRSRLRLHLAAGARLLGSADPADYRAGRGVPPSNGNLALLYASGAENIVIDGPGSIDGNGAKFFNGHGDNTGPGGNPAAGYFQRPHLLVFHACRGVRLRDVFLTASAYHTVRLLSCDGVMIDGVRVHSRVNKNNDGFHLSSSRHVHIANCDVACQDDACALFGSCRYVTVSNCTFSTRWSVFRFGGGEAGDITVSNCVITETYGCPIKLRAGAGTRFENIVFSNLVLTDVTGPISIGLDSKPRRQRHGAVEPRPRGLVRNIAFRGLRATVVATGRQHADLPFPSEFRPGETRTCIALNGVGDEFLENISLSDVHVTYAGGGTAAEAAVRAVPAIAGEYFELGTPPAYGLYARNVRGLTLHNVRFEFLEADRRPAIVLDHVSDAGCHAVAAAGDPGAESLVRVIDSRDLLFSGSRTLGAATSFLRAEGRECAGIVIEGGQIRAAEIAQTAAGAPADAVQVRA